MIKLSKINIAVNDIREYLNDYLEESGLIHDVIMEFNPKSENEYNEIKDLILERLYGL